MEKNKLVIEGSPEESFTISRDSSQLTPCILFRDFEIIAHTRNTGVGFDDWRVTLDVAIKIMEISTSILCAVVFKVPGGNKWDLALREYPLEEAVEEGYRRDLTKSYKPQESLNKGLEVFECTLPVDPKIAKGTKLEKLEDCGN